MRRITKLGALALVAPLALTFAACGSPATGGTTGSGNQSGAQTAQDVYDELNALPADKARERAIELAKDEGGLSMYTENPEFFHMQYAEKFTEDTGIKVVPYRASSVDLTQQILQQSDAGRLEADVMVGSYPAFVEFNDAGILAAYEGAGLDALGDKGVFDGGWVLVGGYLVAPVWNTDLIAKGDEPNSFEDLADPKYNGKLAVAAEDGDIYGAISTYWASEGKSQDEINGLWADILDGARQATGHSNQMQALGAGQWAVSAWNYSFIADLAINDEGSPVSYRYDKMVEAFPYPLGLAMFKESPNPASAWLFNDWMLNEGQDVWNDIYFLTGAQVAGLEPVDGVDVIPFPYEVEENLGTWNDAWDKALRGVESAG